MYSSKEAEGIANVVAEPVPRQLLRGRVVRVGTLRLPLTLTCAPRASLVRFPDGRLLWTVRLWEVDGVVTHVVSTETLRTFARLNQLPSLASEIDQLVARALARPGP